MSTDLPAVPPDVLSEQLTHRAQELWNSGRLQQASEVLEDALRMDPGNDRARADAGMLCLLHQDTNGAIRYAEGIRGSIRGHGAPDLLRLRLAKALHDSDTIERILQASIESAHERPELMRCLAQLASEAAMGGHPISPELLGDWRPKTTEDELHYIYLHFHCGDREEAMARLDSLMLRHPADPWVARCAASLWNATGDGSRSIETLYEALQEDPENALVLRPLLNRLILAKQRKEAVAIAKRLMAVDPGYISAERCLFFDDIRHLRLGSAGQRYRRLERHYRSTQVRSASKLTDLDRIRQSATFPWRRRVPEMVMLTLFFAGALLVDLVPVHHPLELRLFFTVCAVMYSAGLLTKWVVWKRYRRRRSAEETAT